jgi:hypothetical protein
MARRVSGRNLEKEDSACGQDTDGMGETNKKRTRPHVAELMHKNQKMALNNRSMSVREQ